MKHSGGSANTRRSRKIKVAPMTRAVRMALAASIAALALGAATPVFAAQGKAPATTYGVAIDATPVVDLTVVRDDAVLAVAPLSFAALAIDESDPGDVTIYNADPISESDFKYGVTAISGYSDYGTVSITNTADGELYAGSVYGSAIGIYGYSVTGDVSIDNAGDIAAYSYSGLADGIFASGADVDVTNSGAIETYGYTWSAGIEAQGADSVEVSNSGDISSTTAGFYQVYAYSFYDYTGGVVAYAPGNQAFGIYATGGEGGATVGNSGDIEVQGGYVTGIEVQSGGDVSVTNSGDIVAGEGLQSGYYYDAGTQTAYYIYSGTQVATGINASSNGEGAHVGVTNSGDITAEAIFGASGIAATSGGYGGTASVDNSGDIYVSQNQKYGYGAYGIVVSADGDGSIDNSGAVEVYSGGAASGLTALSFAGDASVTNSGDVSATSTASLYYGASGIVAFAGNGDAFVDNSGSVTATADYIARAVDAQGQQDVSVTNSGSLYADGKYAYGVFAQSSGGDVSVTNTDEGEIGFYSYFGDGFGVLGIAYTGDVNVDNAGAIEGYAYGQAVGVFGLALEGDVTVTNSGSITAITGGDAAVGVFARADYGTATVDNSGDIYASVLGVNGFYGDVAYGVLARGEYVEVSNSGNIDALGIYYATGIAATSYYGTVVHNTGGSISAWAMGDATGIDAQSFFGSVAVDNASDVEAVGLYYSATGISGVAYGDVAIENSGDIYAGSLYGTSIGIYGYSLAGDVSIENSGDINAVSYYGLADGIFASGANVDVSNSGAIETYGYTWSAGIEAQGADSVSVTNSGDIAATAPGFYQGYVYSYLYGVGGVFAQSYGGQAFGIYATGGEGGASVANSGDIEVQGGYVTGIEVQSGGDIAINNSGDIVAGNGLNVDYGYYEPIQAVYTYYTGTVVATGINAASNGEGAHVGVTNSGDITADAIFGASGIAATSSGYGGTASVTNSGSVIALQDQKYGYGAYGIVVSADSDASIANSGMIEVYSGGIASGATALSFAGDASVTNSGDIDVSNGAQLYYSASGIVAFGANGDAHAANSGSITATSQYWATGIDARGFGDATVGNSGSISADGMKYAFGVYATAGVGDVSVVNTATGDISAYSYLGRGWGVFGHSEQGDVNVVNAGAIESYAYGQSAGIFGIAAQGDVKVTNSGSIEAITGGNVAVGVFARADYGTASVANGGDIIASVAGVNGYYGDDAYGVLARGDYAQVGNSGSIYAFGIYSATGIAARSYYGTTVTTTASSEIEAYSLLVTIGIEGRSEYGNVSVTNAGDISVEGVLGGGVGIQAYSGLGNVSVANSGEIAASSEYGTAIGVTGYSILGNTAVSNSGTIDATGYYGAYGIAAQSYLGDVTVANSATGHIHASAPSYAYGILASAYGDVTINNAGAVSASAEADGHAAAVLMESLYGHSTLNNAATGVISVVGTDGYAFAVLGSDAVDTINNSGRITGALALYDGNDVFNNRSGGVWSTGGTHSTDFGDGNDTINNLAGGLIDIQGGTITLGADNDTLANAGTVRVATGGTISFGDGNDILGNAASGLIDLVGGTIAMEGGNDTISNAGNFRLNGGSVTMGAGANAFSNIGLVKVLGSSSIDMGGGTFTNSALVDFLDGATDDKLTLAGTLAGTGHLNLDLNLVNGTADQLQVNGNVAANAVQAVNVNFAGMPVTAHSSAVFARVTGTSVAGNFVAGQMIGYNEPANFLDLDLSVSSQINTANTAADVFSINLDVVGLMDTGTLAANVATGAAGMLNAQVGTFKQRMGVNPYGDAGKVMSAFFRTYTSEGDVDPSHVAANFGQGGNFAYDQSTWGREVGVNANLFGDVHAGLTFGSADGRQRLTGAGVGMNRMDGLTWGLYATWLVPQGFYVDVSGRWMAVDVVSTSVVGQSQTRAHTGAWNLEAGYEWMLGGLTVVPQVQYTRTEVEDVRTIHGPVADFEGHGGTSSRGRVGVEVSKTFQSGSLRWTPYGSINAIREFDGDMTYTVADNFFGATSTQGTSTMAELGLGLQSGGWGFTIGANWVDGGAFKSTVGGQAVVRLAW
ncbi:MAG: hypothetical protein EOP93_00180 [Lysobacteraceae bacterium]|nr:MAG: hypothetical protein EOP93_00180 [Xanthomonadaceae bacterium]